MPDGEGGAGSRNPPTGRGPATGGTRLARSRGARPATRGVPGRCSARRPRAAFPRRPGRRRQRPGRPTRGPGASCATIAARLRPRNGNRRRPDLMLRSRPMRSRLARVLLLGAILGEAAGCWTASYLAQQGGGQLRLLRERRRVADVLADPRVDAETKRRLRLAAAARDFGIRELGLRGDGNYTRFLDTHGAPVAWMVSAAPQDRLVPYRFRFPLVGALPYVGFFREADARRRGRAPGAPRPRHPRPRGGRLLHHRDHLRPHLLVDAGGAGRAHRRDHAPRDGARYRFVAGPRRVERELRDPRGAAGGRPLLRPPGRADEAAAALRRRATRGPEPGALRRLPGAAGARARGALRRAREPRGEAPPPGGDLRPGRREFARRFPPPPGRPPTPSRPSP